MPRMTKYDKICQEGREPQGESETRSEKIVGVYVRTHLLFVGLFSEQSPSIYSHNDMAVSSVLIYLHFSLGYLPISEFFGA